MKWNPLKLSEFWTSVELPMQWALIRELRSYMLQARPKKSDSPRPTVSASGEKTGQSRRAGTFLLSSHTFGDPEFGHPALQPRMQQALVGVA